MKKKKLEYMNNVRAASNGFSRYCGAANSDGGGVVTVVVVIVLFLVCCLQEDEKTVEVICLYLKV